MTTTTTSSSRLLLVLIIISVVGRFVNAQDTETPDLESPDLEAPVNGGDCPVECCFRFENDEVPQLVYPEAQPNSIGDHTLNINNSLVNTDGSAISGCNGFMSEYYDEQLGEWTSTWTGSDNITRDLIDIFYSTGDILFNVRTIQTFMDPDLRNTLSNRLIRTNISCSNGQFQVDSCVQFTIDGEGSNFTCDYQNAGARCLPVPEPLDDAAANAGTIAGGVTAGIVGIGLVCCGFFYWQRRPKRVDGPLSSADLDRTAPAATASSYKPPREGVKTLLNRIQNEGTLTPAKPSPQPRPPMIWQRPRSIPTNDSTRTVPSPNPTAPLVPPPVPTDIALAAQKPPAPKHDGDMRGPHLYKSPTDTSIVSDAMSSTSQ